jgi:AraC family transcriptional regulator
VPGTMRSISRRPGEFYGTPTRTLELAGHSCSEVNHRPGSSTPAHHHQHAFLCVVVTGGFTTRGARCVEYRPQTLVFHPAGEIHAERFSTSPVRTLNIELDDCQLTRLGPLKHSATEPWSLGDAATAWMGNLIYREFSAPDPLSGLSVESALASIFIQEERVAQLRSGMDPAIRQVVALIHDRFREPLTLQALSDESGLAPGRLLATFRTATGETPASYQRSLRLRYGLHLLSTTRDPIAQIAVAAGFTDQSHFTHTVKRATGSPPLAYRRAAVPHLPNVQCAPSFVQDVHPSRG